MRTSITDSDVQTRIAADVHDLPPEIIETIISYLPAQTRQWKRIAQSLAQKPATYGPLVKEFDFNQLYYVVTDNLIHDLVQYTPELRTFILASPKQFTDNALRFLSENCRALTRVELWGATKVTEGGLLSLVKNCPRLEGLNLGNGPKVTDRILKALGDRGGSRLAYLNLANGYGLTSAGVSYLLFHTRNTLKHLDLSGCTLLTDASFEFRKVPDTDWWAQEQHQDGVEEVNLDQVSTTMQSLSALRLSPQRSLPNTPALPTTPIPSPSPFELSIETLSLSRVPRLTDDTLISLSACAPRLTSLSIVGVPLITDFGIRAIFQADMARIHLRVLEVDDLVGKVSRAVLDEVELKLKDEGLKILRTSDKYT
ncbi:hypothetical protein HK102_000621 [Quaeritorhiza haematococci]|nr:hypothetical protein HK102_000621 [Quaeritorhiza haematococci]